MYTMKIAFYGVFWLSILFLSGCETAASIGNSLDKGMAKVVPFYHFDKTLLESVYIQSSVDSNNNVPVALDIVFVFNDKAAEVLSALSGPDWFINKKRLLLRYQKNLVVSEQEVVPYTAEYVLILPKNYFNAVSVYLFANYLDQDGQYQADLTQYKVLKITLNRQNYLLEENKP